MGKEDEMSHDPISLNVTVHGIAYLVHYYEGYAAVTGGPPDAWCPEEEAEIVVVSATDAEGNAVECDFDDEDNDDLYLEILDACNEPLQAIYEEESAAMAALDAELEAAAAEYDAMLQGEGLL